MIKKSIASTIALVLTTAGGFIFANPPALANCSELGFDPELGFLGPSRNDGVEGRPCTILTVASDTGINLRKSASLNGKSGVVVPKGTKLAGIGYKQATAVNQLRTDGKKIPDRRWYLVLHKGKEYFVPAAWVFGDLPDTEP